MATTTTIPVSEYLATTYRPDCDYIDGESKSATWANTITAEFSYFLERFF